MSDGPRWLDTEAVARHLCVRTDAVRRLVKARRIPPPNYVLGKRSPRWDRLTLDAAFDGGTASTNPQQMVDAVVQEIVREGRARTRRRRG